MKLSTTTELPVSETKIHHQSKVFAIGSCFVTNVGGLLQEYKIPTLLNPFGIVYNPVSIATQVERLLKRSPVSDEELLAVGDTYVHFDYHSDMRAATPEDWRTIHEEKSKAAYHQLIQSDVIIITLGTSIVYRDMDDRVVANCHKQPASSFTKEMLSIEEMISSLQPIIRMAVDKHLILTVSPVRHTKDGILNNQRSKARLIEVAHYLSAEYDHVGYFPAYEIMMDELRDYRYYQDDLIHPTPLAVRYIWERFGRVFFSDETMELNARIHKINQAVQHRPFDRGSTGFKKFCSDQITRIQDILSTYPELDFDRELSHFQSYL